MLYDRVMRDLDDAEAAIRAGDRHGSNKALLHAQDIVAELELALDPSVWDAAKELATVYVFALGRLVRANVAMDLVALEEVRTALGPLRDAWTKAWEATLTPAAPATAPSASFSTSVRQPLDVAG